MERGRSFALAATDLSRVPGALTVICAATSEVKRGVANGLYVHSSPSISTLWLVPCPPVEEFLSWIHAEAAKTV